MACLSCRTLWSSGSPCSSSPVRVAGGANSRRTSALVAPVYLAAATPSPGSRPAPGHPPTMPCPRVRDRRDRPARRPGPGPAEDSARARSRARSCRTGTLTECDHLGDSRTDYSARHHRHGVNVQAVTDPADEVLWISLALPRPHPRPRRPLGHHRPQTPTPRRSHPTPVHRQPCPRPATGTTRTRHRTVEVLADLPQNPHQPQPHHRHSPIRRSPWSRNAENTPFRLAPYTCRNLIVKPSQGGALKRVTARSVLRRKVSIHGAQTTSHVLYCTGD
ncbi:hypothetical protein FHS40_008913 [Streptomyces spectabilis]|uniref:Uncharacterized protein n=1 Tax=Streptomyces spectabilis TaxID=68270 RepID=A0A7W8EZV0_STRST|nr:hypothetical protein [Streptomyces spectabilis]